MFFEKLGRPVSTIAVETDATRRGILVGLVKNPGKTLTANTVGKVIAFMTRASAPVALAA